MIMRAEKPATSEVRFKFINEKLLTFTVKFGFAINSLNLKPLKLLQAFGKEANGKRSVNDNLAIGIM
jgi:hypothetical protein